MSIANKTFKNNITGEVVRVIDAFENIAILENKNKVNVSELMNSGVYTELIDPANFFSNQGAYNILAEKIKSIPPDMIKDEDGSTPVVNLYENNEFRPINNDSAIVYSTEEDERAELMRKYGANNNEDSLQKQNEAFSKLLGEDEPVLRVEVDNNANGSVQSQQPVFSEKTFDTKQNTIQEDPIVTMFKNVKRIKDFSISLEINNKIPRPDFIEMMEDSYNTSIIDFLALEFTQNILSNPQMIEDMIRQKIRDIVYGPVETPVDPQITDAVTQVKPDKVIKTEPLLINEDGKKPTTRKPRAKKESTEK
jgi:hypothetical protein